jgi:hypothetical protein
LLFPATLSYSKIRLNKIIKLKTNNMKKLITILFVLTFFVGMNVKNSLAQVPIAYYDFETNANRTVFENAIEQQVNTGATSWVKTGGSSTTIFNSTGMGIGNGGTNAGKCIVGMGWSNSTVNTTAYNQNYFQFTLSTSGFTGITVTFQGASVNGTTYTGATRFGVAVLAGGTWYISSWTGITPGSWYNLTMSSAMNAAVENQASVTVRVFGFGAGGTASNNDSYFYIDNFTLNATGTTGTITKTLLNETAYYDSWISSSTPGNTALNRTNFTINSGAYINLGSWIPIIGTFLVNSGGTLNSGTTKWLQGAGIFTLSSGATLVVGSPDGITSSGTFGNIITTTRNFNTGANYVYEQSLALMKINNSNINNDFNQKYEEINNKLLNVDKVINLSSADQSENRYEYISTKPVDALHNKKESISDNIDASSQVTGTGLPASVNNIKINNSLGVVLTNSVTVNGSITPSAGILDLGTNTLTLAGTIGTIGTGSITSASSSTVYISGPASLQNNLFTSNAVQNLTIDRSGGVTMGGDLTTNGALTLTTGTFGVGTNTLTINSTATAASGSITSSATGTVKYYQGSNAQTVLPFNYGNLIFSNYNKILSSAGTIGIAGTFTTGTATGHTISGSTINYNGSGSQSLPVFNYYNLQLSTGGTKTFPSGTTGIANNLTINSPATGDAVSNSSTIDYNGSGAQTIGAINYYNLALSNSGTKSFQTGYSNIAGNFAINGSAAADATTNTPTTIVFNGTTFGGQTAAGISYVNLTINNSYGVALGSPANVSGILTLQNGIFGNSTIFDKTNKTITKKDNIVKKDSKTTINKKGNSIDTPLGNNVTLGNAASITVTDGSISVAPVFGTSVNITYNGAASGTGPEMPSALSGILNNLTVNTAGIALTLNSDVAVGGLLTLSKNLIIGSNTLGFNGTITGAGSLTGSAASNLSIAGTGNLGTVNFTSGAEILNNLSINRTSSGLISIGTILNVNNALTLTSGNINMGSNTLTLGTDITNTGTLNPSVPTSGSYIIGSFERWIPASTTSAIYFPVGSTGQFRQASITYTKASSGGRLKVNGYEGDPGTTTTNNTLTETGGYVIDRYSKEAWWSVTTSDVSGGTYNITLQPNLITGVDPTNFNLLRVLKRTNNTSDWTLVGDHADATGSYQFPIVQRTNLKGFSEFGIGGYSGDGNVLNDAPLPILLSSFTSVIKGHDVDLKWSTDKETNNSGFDVERAEVSSKNLEYRKIGYVKGNGTTNSPVNYTFEDNKLNSGKYNYRLKQIDYNGNFEYHNLTSIVDVSLPTKFNLSQNYPNPFNPNTKVDFDLPFDSKVNIVLYDMTGRQVKTLVNETRTAGYHTIQFNASDLSSGMYFYRIIVRRGGSASIDFVATKKMALIK